MNSELKCVFLSRLFGKNEPRLRRTFEPCMAELSRFMGSPHPLQNFHERVLRIVVNAEEAAFTRQTVGASEPKPIDCVAEAVLVLWHTGDLQAPYWKQCHVDLLQEVISLRNARVDLDAKAGKRCDLVAEAIGQQVRKKLRLMEVLPGCYRPGEVAYVTPPVPECPRLQHESVPLRVEVLRAGDGEDELKVLDYHTG